MQRPPFVHTFVGLGLGILFLCILSVTCALALPSGLVAWWPGDSNANDLSGNGYNATLVNGAQAGVSGLRGGAFQFDGTAAFVSTPLRLPSQGTIDLWVNPTALDSIDGILGTFGLSNGDDRLWLNVRGPLGGLEVAPNHFVVNTGSCCVNEIVASTMPNRLPLGTWTHLALTFDYETDTYALYVNGQVIGISTEARNQPTQLLDFGGQRSNFEQNFYWNGLIDEVHVFNRVLTPQEIQDLATPRLPFATFTAKVDIVVAPRINDAFALMARFTLGPGSDGIDPEAAAVTLTLRGGADVFTTTIPANSFTRDEQGHLTFVGMIHTVALAAQIIPQGNSAYVFKAEGAHANLTGITDPVTVILTIGADSGNALVTATRQ